MRWSVGDCCGAGGGSVYGDGGRWLDGGGGVCMMVVGVLAVMMGTVGVSGVWTVIMLVVGGGR